MLFPDKLTQDSLSYIWVEYGLCYPENQDLHHKMSVPIHPSLHFSLHHGSQKKRTTCVLSAARMQSTRSRSSWESRRMQDQVLSEWAGATCERLMLASLKTEPKKTGRCCWSNWQKKGSPGDQWVLASDAHKLPKKIKFPSRSFPNPRPKRYYCSIFNIIAMGKKVKCCHSEFKCLQAWWRMTWQYSVILKLCIY